MKPHTLRLSALITAAALAAAGCTSVADMMGYDSATLNASAAKSYTQVCSKRKTNACSTPPRKPRAASKPCSTASNLMPTKPTKPACLSNGR